MSHIDFNMGVYYPQGGIYKVVEALERICLENGVSIKTNSEVKSIKINRGLAVAVVVNQKKIESDIVISNADYPYTEVKLLRRQHQTYSENYWKKRTLAPSAFLIYLGIKGKVKNLSHHTLSFANNWEAHFEEIFKKPLWPQKPSYYICCPSKTDQTVAPKDCENLFILIPVASDLKDTDEIRNQYANKILEDVENLIGERIKDRIIVKRIFSQKDFKTVYNFI